MRRSTLSIAVLVAGVLCWPTAVRAQAAADAGADADTDMGAVAPRKTLRIALAGSKPFIIKEGDAPTGLSVDVWKTVAQQLNVDSTFTVFDQVSDALDAVAEGRADLAVGPISITAKRSEKVDFTQPYFAASAGIMTPSTPSSAWARFRPLLSRAFMIGLVLLVVVLFLIGNLIWLAERRTNSENFPAPYLPGVFTGMWFALATMTTVGYGDKVPITRSGRSIAGLWMLISMVAVSSVTAGIATALTLSQIQTAGITDLTSLSRRRVVVVDGTPGQKLGRRYHAQVITAPDKAAALKMIERGEVDAMIYDLPVLQYHLHENPHLELTVYESSVTSDNYGFAAARGSPLVRQINVRLLEMREAGRMQQISDQWLVH